VNKLQEARLLAEKYRNLFAKANAQIWGEIADATLSEVDAKEVFTVIEHALPWEPK